MSLTQEECAALVDQMISEPKYSEQRRTKLALMIAANAIRRGRHLTAEEKWANIQSFLEE